MWNQGTVRSLIESHRAKSSHPDRRNFISQSCRIQSAAQFSGQLPQLRSIAPISPATAPIFRTAAPNFSPVNPIYNSLFHSHLCDLLPHEGREAGDGWANPAFSSLRRLRARRATCISTHNE
jgi:hypothetical protein